MKPKSRKTLGKKISLAYKPKRVHYKYMRPNVKIYKHIPLEREIRSLAKHGEGGRMEEFRDFHGGRWKITKWWKNGEEDEDGVERKWRRERKVKVGMCHK